LKALNFVLFGLTVLWGILWLYGYLSQRAWLVLTFGTPIVNSAVVWFEIVRRRSSARQSTGYQSQVDSAAQGTDVDAQIAEDDR
jgi:hypothetical protein